MMRDITVTYCESYITLLRETLPRTLELMYRYRGRMFALDIFKTGFQADTMSREAGRRYREMVLQVGGSQPEMETLTSYLGHKPSPEPYFDFIGGRYNVSSS